MNPNRLADFKAWKRRHPWRYAVLRRHTTLFFWKLAALTAFVAGVAVGRFL